MGADTETGVPETWSEAVDDVTLDENGHLAFSPNDRDNPKDWSFARKLTITVICQLMALNCTFASTAPTGALDGIAETFKVSETAVNLVTTLFLCGYCSGPLLWAPLSEYFGRRWVYYWTFLVYFACLFLCAWAPNFGALLVGRFITGTFVSSAVSNGPGLMADIWSPIARGNAVSIYMGVVFVGPSLGPISAGYISLTVGWRWTFYELLWLAAFTIVCLAFLPETLAARRLEMKAKRLRQKEEKFKDLLAPREANKPSLPALMRRTLVRPFMILIDPICFLITIYVSLVYAVLYMMFTIYPIIFREKRGWNAGNSELPLLGLVVGALIGSLCIFLRSRVERKRALGSEWSPENRLPLAMVGAVILPLSMFWLSWSGNYNSVPWIVPTLAGVFFAISLLFLFASTTNYLADTYIMYAASANAIATVVRSAAAAASPLFTNQMFDALTVGGAGSLLAGVACLLAPVPFIFSRYGGTIRKRSAWAPTQQEVVK